MTEALIQDIPESYAVPAIELPPVDEVRPQLEIVREFMPAFVATQDERDWWYSLPEWRKELYLLPKATTEEERIRQINKLGMTVVSYVGGQGPTTFYPYQDS
jgi:hypothetical protein